MPGPWASWITAKDFAAGSLIEIWDVTLAKVRADDGRLQGDVLLMRAAPPHSPSPAGLVFGDVGLFHYVTAEDDYYHWWMEHGAEQWNASHPTIGNYHLCKEEPGACQIKVKWRRDHPEGVVRVDEFRLMWPGDLKSLKWLKGPKKQRAVSVLGAN